MNEDFKDCMETFAAVVTQLKEVEARLGHDLGLTGDLHMQIVNLAKNNKLVETELAMEWYAAYASWKDWCDEQP